MKIEAARCYHFQAVHSLEEFPEPWCRTHGHAYTIELVGEFNHEQGDMLWDGLRGNYEGADLNDLLVPTTVEALAAHFLEGLDIDGLREVTVWEDNTRWGRATL